MRPRSYPARVGWFLLLLVLGVLPGLVSGQNLTRLEYYFDGPDPGYGLGRAIAFTPGASVDVTPTLDLTGVTPGYHQLTVRGKDALGRWSLSKSQPVWIASVTSWGGPALNLAYAEYYFDTDPGYGLATRVALPAAPDANITFVAPLTGLSLGFHTLYTRVKQVDGAWSLTAVRPIFVGGTAANDPRPNLTFVEYYVDTDPGYGQGTRVNYPTAQPDQDFTFAADLSTVPNGFHTIYVRTRDAAGSWSLTTVKPFFRSSVTATDPAPSVTKIEYYIDADPGYGQAVDVPVTTPGQSIDQTFVADLSSVTNGFHMLFVRVRDAQGGWSLTTVRPFFRANTTGSQPAPNLTRAEYYIDTDPGYGQGTAIAITPGQTVDQTFVADLSAVTNGFHTIYVRVQDQYKAWSLTTVRPFVRQGAVAGGPRPDVVALRWQVFPASSNSPITAAEDYVLPQPLRAADVDVTFTPNLCLTAAGSYVIRLAAVDSTGTPSITYAHPFSITTPTLFQPNLPAVARGCGGQPITLTAAPVGAGGSYLWSTGATTQSISVTTPGNYWVNATSASGCVGDDTTQVIFDAAPTVAMPDTVAAACGAPGVTLDAGAGYATYAWSPGGQTSRTISVSTPGTYTVTVTGASTGSCTAAASTVVVMPRADIQQADQVVCNGASVTLSVSAPTNGTVTWSPGGQTGPSISVTPAATTTYTATVRVGSHSCTDQVTLTVPPVLTPGLPDTTVVACSATAVVLDAGPGATSYLWTPGGQTSRTITVSTPGQYGVTVNNGCAFTDQTYVLLPHADIQQTSQTICEGTSLTLSVATPTNGSIVWSPGGQTTASISVAPSTTTTYTATVTDRGHSCADAVTISVTPRPQAALGGGQVNVPCGQHSTVLDAGAGFGSYLWSTGATSRTITASQGGWYYVTVGNGGCTSRDSALVSLPDATLAQHMATVCAGQSATLALAFPNPANGTVVWMPGGATTTSITVSPGMTTTYTATVTAPDGRTCQDQATVTVNPLPTVTLDPLAPVCVSAAVYALSGGSPAGGTYSGPGVSGGTFNPGAAGVGTHTITYTYSQNGCPNSATRSLTVNPLPTVTLAAFNPVCSGAAVFALTGGAPTGGTYSGPGVSSGQFDATTAGVGTHTITYSYTDGNGCASQATRDLIVLPVPTLAGAVDTLFYCPGQPITLTVQNAGAGASYAWTPGGQTSASITVNPVGAITYGVTVTNAAGCQYPFSQLAYPSPFSTAPAPVSQMEPVDNSAGLSLPLSFTWVPGARTTSFDLYVWPAAGSQPGTPTVSGITSLQYVYNGPLPYGAPYKWRIVSRNPCGTTAGPIFDFRLRELPDVRVSFVQNPDTAYAGQSVQVTWNVTNNGLGSTLAQNWDDAVWFSQDSVFNPATATRLGTRVNTTFLQPNATYITDGTFSVPLSLAGRYYVFVVTDEANALLETNDVNNRRRSPSRTLIIVPTTPDLAVTSFGQPLAVVGGDSALITYRVKNVGQVPATAPWADGFYISPDTAQNIAQNTGQAALGPNARRLYGRVISQTLMPTGQYTTSLKVPVPHTYFGNYYFYAYADDANALFETASTNNVNSRPWTTTQVILRPPPDLVIQPFSVPASVTAGTPLPLSWTGVNQGANPPFFPVETYFGDQAWLSASPTFDPQTAISLGTVYQYNAHTIQPMQSWSGAGALNVPNGMSGLYWVFIQADAGNTVFEHVYESNNMRRSNNQVQVNLVYADLHPTALTAPATVPAHTSFTVSWTVQNTATAVIPAGGAWTDNVYANNFLVASVRHSGPLAIGASYSASAVVSLPIAIGPGPLTLRVVTDAGGEVYEFNFETNNERTTSTTLLYSDDLAVSQLAAPGPALSGQNLTASWRVSNLGAYRTLASGWADELYLSANSVLDGADLRVARLGSNNGQGQLNAGGFYDLSATFRLPHGLSGTYYLIARTAIDPNGALADADPTNNQQVITRPISLTVPCDLRILGTPILSAASVVAGQQLTVTYQVKNHGAGATLETEWNDGIYLNTSPTMSGATRIGNAHHSGRLNANAQYGVTLPVTVPGYLAGNYYVFIVTDNAQPDRYTPTVGYWGGAVQYGDVYEHQQELNNSWQGLLTVTVPLPADLEVTAVSVPGTATLGRHMAVQYSVKNRGTNPAVGLLKDAVFLSENRVLDGAVDRIFASSTRNLTIAPGQTLITTLRERVQAVNPGLYHGIAGTNLYDDIYETDRTNDTLSTPGQVSVGINVLPMLTLTPFPLDLDTLAYYKVTPGANKDLLLALGSNQNLGQNEIYVAYNRVPTPADFDFIYEDPINTRQDLLIPSTGPGDYYILVKTPYVYAGLQTATLYAEALPFSVREIQKDTVGRGRVTTRIRGAGFNATTRFYLTQGTDPTIVAEATPVRRRSSVDVTVRWFLDRDSVATGTYNVVADNAGTRVQLTNGLTVEPSRGLDVDYATIIPATLRSGFAGDWTYFLKNTSNVDVPRWSIVFNVPTNSHPVVTHTPNARKKSDFYPGVVSGTGAGSVYNLLPDGPTDIIPLVAQDVMPDEVVQVNIRLTPPVGVNPSDPPIPYPVVVNSLPASDEIYARGTLDHIARHRAAVLAQPGAYDPGVVNLAANAAAWADSLQRHYARLGLLDTAWIGRSPRTLYNALTSATHVTGGVCDTYFPITEYPVEFRPDPFGAGYPVALTAAPDSVRWLAKTRGASCTMIVGSYDPNVIAGPEGYGPHKFVGQRQVLPYQIQFENDPLLATAPAQSVKITQSLSDAAEPRNFRLGDFGFGPFRFSMPAGLSSYSRTLNLPDSLGYDARITASVDFVNQQLIWVLETLDPATGLPPTDPLKGLLPVNDSTGRGLGFVNYTITPSLSALTGDTLAAQARIVFDQNPEISTNRWWNLVDGAAPTSFVSALPPLTTGTTQVTVTWSGADDANASGLASYDLYVSQDGGPYLALLTGTTATTYELSGVPGSRYDFFTIATDNAGNREDLKLTGDTWTVIEDTTVVVYDLLHNQCLVSDTVVSTGTGQWQKLKLSGKVVASINDRGRALGKMAVQFTVRRGPGVRADGHGKEYLDRNWHLWAQNSFNGHTVDVRFYVLKTEFDSLRQANDGDLNDVQLPADLRVTQYSGANEDCQLTNNQWATAQTRLLLPAAVQVPQEKPWIEVQASISDHFSEFYLNGGNSPLPVELLDFTARRTGRNVQVSWRTASERHAATFVVEAGNGPAAGFAEVGRVAAHGSTLEPHAYALLDTRVPATGGLRYYRLRQEDLDGTVTYSKVVAVQLDQQIAPLAVQAVPNPFGHGTGLTVRVQADAEQATLRLTDLTGRLVVLRTVVLNTGQAALALPEAAPLPAGTYLLTVTTGPETRTLRVVKQ